MSISLYQFSCALTERSSIVRGATTRSIMRKSVVGWGVLTSVFIYISTVETPHKHIWCIFYGSVDGRSQVENIFMGFFLWMSGRPTADREKFMKFSFIIFRIHLYFLNKDNIPHTLCSVFSMFSKKGYEVF